VKHKDAPEPDDPDAFARSVREEEWDDPDNQEEDDDDSQGEEYDGNEDETDEEYQASLDLGEELAKDLQRARDRSDDLELPVESNFEAIGITSRAEACAAMWTNRATNPERSATVDPDSDDEYALVIEDDGFTAQEYGTALALRGFNVLYAFSVEEALKTLEQYDDRVSLVVIDIRMPTGDYFSEFETVGGRKTGVFLAQEILDSSAARRVVALTNSTDSLDISWFEARENCYFCQKRNFPPELFANYVRSTVMKDLSDLKCFIIHGHDKATALELKNYLQNRIGLPEPIILSERRSKNMTIIEKLEHYLKDADYVFAIFTPDDFVVKPTKAKRARQNVVFEFGYVLGLLGRTTGRVFFLHKGDVELPSDLHGVIYIDIAQGVDAAGEDIRRELDDLLS
jgi:predicted nucleotide-binding protein